MEMLGKKKNSAQVSERKKKDPGEVLGNMNADLKNYLN